MRLPNRSEVLGIVGERTLWREFPPNSGKSPLRTSDTLLRALRSAARNAGSTMPTSALREEFRLPGEMQHPRASKPQETQGGRYGRSLGTINFGTLLIKRSGAIVALPPDVLQAKYSRSAPGSNATPAAPLSKPAPKGASVRQVGCCGGPCGATDLRRRLDVERADGVEPPAMLERLHAVVLVVAPQGVRPHACDDGLQVRRRRHADGGHRAVPLGREHAVEEAGLGSRACSTL